MLGFGQCNIGFWAVKYGVFGSRRRGFGQYDGCVLYTSADADDLTCGEFSRRLSGRT